MTLKTDNNLRIAHAIHNKRKLQFRYSDSEVRTIWPLLLVETETGDRDCIAYKEVNNNLEIRRYHLNKMEEFHDPVVNFTLPNDYVRADRSKYARILAEVS